MFTSKAQHHQLNKKTAAGYQAKPALLTGFGGRQEPAVVLFSTSQVRAVMPIPEALRLANEIADAIAAHKKAS